MNLGRRSASLAWLLALAAGVNGAGARDVAPTHEPAAAASHSAPCPGLVQARRLQRTELFFGRNSPQGDISEQDFQNFLDTEVTPRFPEGLTVIDVRGQFRAGADAAVEKEAGKLLVLLYRADRRSHAHVEAIRSRYRARFAQQSVLRVDSVVCAAF